MGYINQCRAKRFFEVVSLGLENSPLDMRCSTITTSTVRDKRPGFFVSSGCRQAVSDAVFCLIDRREFEKISFLWYICWKLLCIEFTKFRTLLFCFN